MYAIEHVGKTLEKQSEEEAGGAMEVDEQGHVRVVWGRKNALKIVHS